MTVSGKPPERLRGLVACSVETLLVGRRDLLHVEGEFLQGND
jgi:hypothetical protein